jgi:hypothetical protein
MYRIGLRQARAAGIVLITSDLFFNTNNPHINVLKIIIKLIVESRIVRAHP